MAVQPQKLNAIWHDLRIVANVLKAINVARLPMW